MRYSARSVRKVFLLLMAVLGLMWLGLVGCSGETPVSQELTDAAVVETGTYILTAKHSGMVLDLPNSNPRAGVQLWQYPRNNTKAQQWKIEAIDSTYVKITSLVNGYALYAGLPKDGAKVSLQPYSTTNAKQWILVAVSGGYYEIVNRASGGRLDVSNFGTVQGALVTTWTRNNGDNQKWKLEKVGETTPTPTSNYQQNLQMITKATVRNRNLDSSAYRNTPMASLPTGATSPLLGPRSDYLQNAGGNPEVGFPARGVGTFRTSCEFSHFAYDDPLVHPNKPGAAHLHMFWGNTNVNAYSTYNTLYNSGSSTCNGVELNRTGYWAPAMFDAKGNVRVPERIIVYYKGYGLAQGKSIVYPPKAAMVIDDIIHRTSDATGGVAEMNFLCSDQFRAQRTPASLTIPVCDGSSAIKLWGSGRAAIEMHVKFANCWNRQDPSNPKNWLLSRAGVWFYSNCEERATLPNIHYIIAYPLEPGETTAGWYIASDVDPTTRTRTKAGGSTVHADWWGAWNPAINKEWIDNCVNFKRDFNGDGIDDEDHGCGFGYLSNGGPELNGAEPFPGRALKYRQQYTGPIKVAASTLYRELCPGGSAISSATAAAYCKPAPMNMQMSGGAVMDGADSSTMSHDHH
jgi:Domain of unknown function (DUF1996)/Ricin-type beta-trefoil lectin domain-like